MATRLDQITSAVDQIQSVVARHSDKLPPETIKLVNQLVTNVHFDVRRIQESVWEYADMLAGTCEF